MLMRKNVYNDVSRDSLVFSRGEGGSVVKSPSMNQNDFAQILNGCVFLYRREKISNV